MYEIYELLLSEKGCKTADVARETGINQTVFSEWKKGKSTPKSDKMQKIADFFNVPLEYLLGKNGIVTCQECGMMYYASDIIECRTHDEFHRKYLSATRFYGSFYSLPIIENEKNKYLNIASNYDNTFEARVNAWIEVIRAYFSRSLSGWNYELEHPTFDNYAAMLLNTKTIEDRINDTAVFTRLVRMYGKQEGLEEGKTYCRVPQTITQQSLSANEDENLLLKEFSKLNEKGKSEAVNRVTELTYIPQYTDNSTNIAKKKERYIPTEEDIRSLVARNGKKMTRDEAIEFITEMYSDDDE
jgi:transcriptional regulator with XRE-family HTH domain